MSSQQGWICLHRKFLEWEWFTDINTCHLFTYLLLKANHKDKKHQGTLVKRGQIKAGRNTLAEVTGLSVQKLRTALDKLKSTNEITIKSYNKYSIITITYYDKYQSNNQQDNHQITNKQPSNNHQITTNNNENNINNDNNDNKIEVIKPQSPPLQEMINLWNDKIQKIIKPDSRGVMLTNGRKSKLAKRFKDEFNSDLEQWEMYLNKISQSNFLMGDNNRNWSIDIDWALEPKNLIKIVESNYDNKNNSKQQSVHNMVNSIAGF